MFLKEYLEENSYRVQSLPSFMDVVLTNKFRTSVAYARDQIFNRGKLYYFSTARTLSSDFIDDLNSDDVIIILDGKKLNNNFRSIPIKYFKEIDESEERIITNKEYIHNAIYYIKSVHILMEEEKYSKNTNLKLKSVIEVLRKNNIDYWFYKTREDLIKLNIKNATKKPNFLIGEKDPEYPYSAYVKKSDLNVIFTTKPELKRKEILPVLENLIKKYILKIDISNEKLDSLIQYIERRDLTSISILVSNIIYEFESFIRYSDDARPQITSFMKTLKLANLPFSFEKIFEIILPKIRQL